MNMPDKLSGPASPLEDDAHSLYQNLAHELARSLKLLRENENNPDAKGLADTIRAHRKALQAILDIEQRSEATQTLGASYEIDLEEAREEIISRLDRLVAT